MKHSFSLGQEEVMRQLMACLVHVGLSFPERPASPRATPPAPNLPKLVDCFRTGEPLPAAAGGHSRGPSGGSAGAHGRWWGGPSPPRTPPPTPPPQGAHVRAHVGVVLRLWKRCCSSWMFANWCPGCCNCLGTM